MFVVYRIEWQQDGVRYRRVKEFLTKEEAEEYLEKHKDDEDVLTMYIE